jgi:nucleoside-diphosphate-sugar epimerase
MPGRVLVTGISGFIGGHVALALLYAGYTVRGSLRESARAPEVAAMLERAGADTSRLEFATLDLLDDAGWREAARGCRYLAHVASPLHLRQPAEREVLVRPAVEGTRRAIEAALEADVERVVLTSSVAAIANGHARDRGMPFTEADWSTTEGEGVNAYSESKTRAELEAWSLMEEAGRRGDLATVNPTVVLGPLLSPNFSASVVLIKRLLDGSAPFAPRLSLNLVDVRDVAALHLAALVSPRAGGHRYIAAAAPVSLVEVVETLRAAFPAFSAHLPRLRVPDWVVQLYALVDADVRANLGSLGAARSFDASPTEALLERPFITARLAASATAQSLIDFGIVRPPGREKRD